MSVVCLNEPHKVKVRKPHTCQGCGMDIEVGTDAIASTFADGGDIWTFYECFKCEAFRLDNCNACKDREFCLELNYQVGMFNECSLSRELKL